MTKQRLLMAMVAAGVLASAGCRTREGTLVEVSVSSTATLPDVAKLAVTATIGTDVRTFDIALVEKSIPPTHVFAIEVPGNRKGLVAIDVDARSSGDLSVGKKSGSVTLSPGDVVSLSLVIGSPDVDMAGDGGGDGGGGDAGGADLVTGPVITPSAPSLGAGRYVQLNADTTVTWAVVGGDVNGTISATGVYNAPFVPGTYTVTATGANGTSQVMIVVRPLVIRLVGGKVGGYGNADGVGESAHFGNAVKLAGTPPEIYAADADNHTVRRINTSLGSVTTVLGVPNEPGGADGTGPVVRFDRPVGIAEFGNLYVQDGTNRVRRINKQSLTVDTLSAPGSVDAGGSNGLLAMVGTNLVLYDPAVPSATTLTGGFTNARAVASEGEVLYVAEANVIKKVELIGPDWVVTIIAGDGTSAGIDDAVGTAASFRGILDMAVVDHSVLVAVDGTCTLRKVSLSGTNAVSTLAGSEADCRYVDGAGAEARFADLYSILGTDSGYVLVADSGAGGTGIRKVDVVTGAVTSVVGRPLQSYGFGVDGPAADAVWTPCLSLGIDGGRLLLPSSGNGKPLTHSIRTVDLTNGDVGTLTGNAELFGSDDGNAAQARFKIPVGIAVVGGDAFIADAGNYTIRKIALATKETTTWAGTAGQKGFVNDTGASARFVQPTMLSYCGGKVLVTDGFTAIRAVDVSTAAVTTLAGDPAEQGTSDGVGNVARFNFESPETVNLRVAGIACDQDGNAYVADIGNRTIRKVLVATGEVTTLTGTPGPGSLVDGDFTSARFNLLTGIAHDGNRTLYVTDENVIRAVDTVTRVTRTVLGKTGVAGVGLGIAPGALNQPAGLAFDSTGDLFVTDLGDNVVLRIEPQ